MQITFGETDGDAEANATRDLVGYIVRIDQGEDSQDYEIDGTDNVGLTVWMVSDDHQRLGPREVIRWFDIDTIHVY